MGKDIRKDKICNNRKEEVFLVPKISTEKHTIYFMKSQILIGAASSGSGKTTFTLGLLRALRNRGISTQPFKCGPDYIDTKYHTLAAGKESVNLDSYMSSAEHIRSLYGRYGKNAKVCVVEGVMGLFDGYNGMQGSSAEIADILNVPVVLLVNAQSTAYSVAPLIYGYRRFYKNIRLVGVVFNKVASPAHYSCLLRACKDAGVPCLGYLPRQQDIEIPSRHLGLTLEYNSRVDEFINRIASLIEKYIDIEDLLYVTGYPFHYDGRPAREKYEGLRIAVARDEAFNFTYRENIAQLSRMGDVTFFSPMKAKRLPKADFVYLPGGYPEFFLAALSENASMLRSVKQYAEAEGKILAECGGMMYLSNAITGMDGVRYPMAGVLNQEATMESMKLKLGYRNFNYRGVAWRGHEFHYSQLISPLPSEVPLYNAQGREVPAALIRYKNVIAGYTHLYWGEKNVMDLF